MELFTSRTTVTQILPGRRTPPTHNKEKMNKWTNPTAPLLSGLWVSYHFLTTVVYQFPLLNFINFTKFFKFEWILTDFHEYYFVFHKRFLIRKMQTKEVTCLCRAIQPIHAISLLFRNVIEFVQFYNTFDQSFK